MNKGTEELEKILNSVKNMSTEEYNELYSTLPAKDTDFIPRIIFENDTVNITYAENFETIDIIGFDYSSFLPISEESFGNFVPIFVPNNNFINPLFENHDYDPSREISEAEAA